MSIRRGALLLSFLLAVSACGKEVGRVRLPGEGSGAVELALDAGEIAFWTDLSIEYEGDASLEYRIDVFQNGSSVGKTVCNPLGRLSVKTGWVETNVGSSHTRRGMGNMSCELRLPSAGPTVVKTTLVFGKKPPTTTLRKADLVVKQ